MLFTKRDKLLRFLSLSGFIILLTTALSAQNDAVFITLDEAVQTALVENNLVKAAKYGYEKAEWDVKNSWTNLFPVLDFTTRYTRIDEQTFRERDFRQYLPPALANDIPQTVFQESYSSSFNLSVPIFNMNLYNGIRMANKGELAAEAYLKSTRDNITFQVVSAYLNILKMDALKDIRQNYLALSEKNLAKAERLFEADRYSKNEVLRWKIDYQQQKSGLVETENGYVSSVAVLNRLLNRDMKAQFDYQGVVPEKLKSETDKIVAMSDDELTGMIKLSDEQLVKLNSALRAMYDQNEISKITYQNSYSNYMPNVNFTYNYAWRENNTLAFDDYSPKTVMVNFSLPIFTGFQNITKLKSSYKEYKKSSEEFEDQKQNIRLALIELIHRIKNLKTQKELADVNEEYSKSNYDIVENRKDLGLASNIEFIDAKLNYQNAVISGTNAYYDLVSAVTELYYMLGKINIVLQ